MFKHYKQAIYLWWVRLICLFPKASSFLLIFFDYIFINFPWIRTTFRWKLIRKKYIDFELNHRLFKKGKSCKFNRLFDIQIENAAESQDIANKKKTGNYKVSISFYGLVVSGYSIKNSYVSLFVESNMLRKTQVNDEGFFSIVVDESVVEKFPKNCTITVLDESNRRLTCEGDEKVSLFIPFADSTLQQILETGHTLSKKGFLMKTDNETRTSQDKLLELYSSMRKVFKENFNLDLFITYGTLLGYHREGDLIKNDDDFDAGYISQRKNPEEVKYEALTIVNRLLQLGYNITINPTGRLFRVPLSAIDYLDLMPVWFEKEWNVGFRGSCIKASIDDFLPVRVGLLRGIEICYPRNPEAFLIGYYGKNWNIPDPGYVSNYKQTGQHLVSNYDRYMLTPKEYFQFIKKIEFEKSIFPNYGLFKSAAFD